MKVCVASGARIHINSIDMSGAGVRAVGGLGFRVRNPTVAASIHMGKLPQTQTPPSYTKLVRAALDRVDLRGDVTVVIHSTTREHVGLGTQTQVSLCLLEAVYGLAGQPLTPADAFSYGVGRLSGVGLGAFFSGGLIIDGGYSQRPGARDTLNGQNSDGPAPIVFAHNFPEEWKVLLAIPHTATSISGAAEVAFFKRITPIPKRITYELAYHVLMGIAPSVLEKNFIRFLDSVHTISQLGTKPFEEALHEHICGPVLRYLRAELGFASISSLGPTVFSFSTKPVDLDSYRAAFPEFTFAITTVDNTPRLVERDNR
jgi:beta-ribofuranosylaminobenzene 5'-phosphate synthase